MKRQRFQTVLFIVDEQPQPELKVTCGEFELFLQFEKSSLLLDLMEDDKNEIHVSTLQQAYWLTQCIKRLPQDLDFPLEVRSRHRDDFFHNLRVQSLLELMEVISWADLNYSRKCLDFWLSRDQVRWELIWGGTQVQISPQKLRSQAVEQLQKRGFLALSKQTNDGGLFDLKDVDGGYDLADLAGVETFAVRTKDQQWRFWGASEFWKQFAERVQSLQRAGRTFGFLELCTSATVFIQDLFPLLQPHLQFSNGELIDLLLGKGEITRECEVEKRSEIQERIFGGPVLVE